jgi:hypothetical protein
MSKEQTNETEQQPINQDRERIEKAFFSKECTILSGGVIISAERKEESADVIITNEDIADIYNAINGESPFDEDEKNNE